MCRVLLLCGDEILHASIFLDDMLVILDMLDCVRAGVFVAWCVLCRLVRLGLSSTL